MTRIVFALAEVSKRFGTSNFKKVLGCKETIRSPLGSPVDEWR